LNIKYYYEIGYGNHLSPFIGMPWLLASTNLFTHSTPTNQNLYISVAHREMLPVVLTALGLYNDSSYINASHIKGALPLDQINYHRRWKSSKILLFLGHIALERLYCKSVANNGSFIRILVNSTLKTLPGCANGPGASCPLRRYIDYVDHRHKRYKNFSKVCQIHYNTTDLFTLYQKDDN